MELWNQLDEDEIKAQVNIIPFRQDPSSHEVVRYGIFYGIDFRGKSFDCLHGGKVLIEFYNSLCKALNGKVYDIKAIMIPDTPPGRMYKHNILKNVVDYADDFQNRLIDCLAENYTTQTTQQLVLATTDYVPLHFYKMMDEMKWDRSVKLMDTTKEKSFAKITTYFNDYILPNTSDSFDLMYSVVKVECGCSLGIGLLLRTPSQVVCISCNHLFQSFQNSPPQAISHYANAFKFNIIPKKEIIIHNYDDSILPAKDEVAILIPQWNGRILFDLHGILELKNLDDKIGDYVGYDCSCYGCQSGSNQGWSDPFKLQRRIAQGYFQTRIDGTTNIVEGGYSGGIISPEKSEDIIIGIHEGRFGEGYRLGRVIPCTEIKNVIKEVVL